MKRLTEYQREAVDKMHDGCVLIGGVGSGKTLTSLSFIFENWLHGVTPLLHDEFMYSSPKNDIDVYVITTARKRDSLDWKKEASDIPMSIYKIDSWNNINKYTDVSNSIFIFDETRILGYGSWTKAFLKITKNNKWVLLSATPADTWMEFMPLFLANGHYRNKTDFEREHVIYSRFAKYPKVDRYLGVAKLIEIRNSIVVTMKADRHTMAHHQEVYCTYDPISYKRIMIDRWDIFKDVPIQDAGKLCFALRKVVNSDVRRKENLSEILSRHHKVIIFYNFDYELTILRDWCSENNIVSAEWNGHKHEELPTGDEWVYLCQYIAASEAWNAITTNCVIFYSPTYSYKMLTQASGRIDRMNTPYADLYYYHLLTRSSIDLAISKSLHGKRNFNENKFAKF